MFLLLTAGLARAACTYSQTTAPDHVDITLTAGPGVIHCRTVTLTSAQALTVVATHEAYGTRPKRIPTSQMRLLPGGGWELSVPDLAAGDRLRVSVAPAAADLTVALAPAGDAVDPAPVHGRLDELWAFRPDPDHPAWGFADPTRGHVDVHRTYRFDNDAPAQLLGHPSDSSVATPITRGAGTLTPVPGGWRWSGGAGEVDLAWASPGMPAQGVVQVGRGSLTVQAPGVAFRTTGPATATADGWTVTGGTGDGAGDAHPTEVRWRVLDAGGAAVIPDVPTFLSGLAWRFARLSLPEPAVPVRYAGLPHGEELMRALYAEAQALLPGSVPGADALHPRPLNAAWRSGWATPVERGLILARFLEQEKWPAGVVYTGEAPDPVTLTGYDHVLLQVPTDNGTLWLDPGCAACDLGEISPRWMGKPALGAAERVPALPGRLVRRIRLGGTTYVVRFEARGAAALWLRSLAQDADPPALARRLGDALGVPDATLLGVSADLAPDAETLPDPWKDVVHVIGEDSPGATVVELRTGRAPGAPLGGADTPWTGGWTDEL